MLKRDTEELVLEYCQTRDLELRDAITIQLSGLVESIARKFIGSGEPIEDLIQEGYLGLLNALDLFKPEKGVKFTTYATHLIVGQIKHYLRDKGKIIKEPAWLQELNSKINRVTNELSARYGRPPTTQEIAEFLGMTTKAVEDVLMTREVFKVSSLDAIYEDEEEEWNGYDLEKLNCEPCQTFNLPIEERVVVETAMQQLKQIEQQVLHLFFEEGYNQTEIAHMLSISCNYVSHILRNATQKLRRIISEAEWLDEQRFRARALARGDFEARILDRRRGCSRRTTSRCACVRSFSAPPATTRVSALRCSSSPPRRARSTRWASSRLASCCCRRRRSCARRYARRTSWGATGTRHSACCCPTRASMRPASPSAWLPRSASGCRPPSALPCTSGSTSTSAGRTTQATATTTSR
jgi:DNA-directed RNA polymerase specialized sigma subunit